MERPRMDRATIYPGQIPLETDQLKQSQNTMVGLAKLAAAVLGQTTIVNGFTCTPTTPASLNVVVTPGEIYQIENLEQSSWSSLPADTHTILKQGVILDAATFGITPPVTVGYSQNFLVETQYQDVDAGATVLPYFYAGSPTVPFSGPGNAGTAQNTVRKGVAALQVKAGIAATTGTQTTPTADAGWTGLFIVTVANGATTITSGNISQLSSAPFIPCTLPNVPITDQSGVWTSGIDTGTTNNYVVTLNPVPTQYTYGMQIRVKMASMPTGPSVINCNALGNKSIVKSGGIALSGAEWLAGDVVSFTFDGANFQINNNARATLSSNRTLYVNGAIGNDANDGISNTAGHALATIQGAMNLAFNYAPSQYAITINVASGTYGPFSTPPYGGPNLIIIGNETTPSNVAVNGGAGVAANIQGPNTVTIRGIRVYNNAGSGWPGFNVQAAASLTTYNTESGYCDYAVFEAFGGALVVAGNHNFTGNCGSCFLAQTGGGQINIGQVTLTHSNITVSNAYATATALGAINCAARPTFTNAAGVTGSKYNCNLNGVINTVAAGVNLFPGTVAGSTSTGGQYA